MNTQTQIQNNNPLIEITFIHTARVEAELLDLLPTFLINRHVEIKKLKTYLEALDFAEIKKIGHDLRGIPGAFGYNFLVEIGKRVEMAAISKNEKLLKDLLQEYELTLRYHIVKIEGDEKLYNEKDFIS